jgi:hypothetical protein
VRTEEIESIKADLHTFSLLRPEPWDDESAGFSGAFVIAATLVHGRFTLDELTDEVVHDPRVTALMKKIQHAPAGDPETITVARKGKPPVTIDVRPVTRLSARADIQAKFRKCAATVLPRSAIERLETMILTLDQQPDISRLMAATAPATADAVPA